MLLLFGLAIVIHARSFGLLSNERTKIDFLPYTPEQREMVARQALDLMSIYVNRESKLQHYSKDYPDIDPIPRMQALLDRAASFSDREFHYRMADIYLSLRDFHTTFSFAGMHACFAAVNGLRFEMIQGGTHEYPIVVVAGRSVNPLIHQLSPSLKNITIGDELLAIDGVSFPDFVASNQFKTGGANLYGAQRSALYRLTSVSGKSWPMPDDDTVLFQFRKMTGEKYWISLPWIAIRNDECYSEAIKVYTQLTGKLAPTDDHLLKDSSLQDTVFEKSYTLDEILRLAENRIFYDMEKALPRKRQLKLEWNETSSDILKWAIYRPEEFNVGVIRLESFSPSQGAQYVVAEIRSLLLNQLAKTDALLFDIRGNPGGYIDLAEGLPQFFVPSFQATTARAIRSPINDAIFHSDSMRNLPYANAYVMTMNGTYSNPYPLSMDMMNNYYGMVYVKPVGILNDANCYSSCDLFSAGMQDFEGAILFGEDGNTGAGGANVVNTRDFFPRVVPQLFPKLPFVDNSTKGFASSFTLAWRQTVRSGLHAGELIEDDGVKTEQMVRPTLSDVIRSSSSTSDQFDTICKGLFEYGKRTGKNSLSFSSDPEITGTAHIGGVLSFKITSSGYSQFEIVNRQGKVLGSIVPNLRRGQQTLAVPLDVKTTGTYTYSIIGYQTQGYLQAKVLVTHRYIRVIPASESYITLEKNMRLSNPISSLTVFNSESTERTSGWQVANNSLVLGNGVEYKENVNSTASLFFKVPNGSTVALDVDASYDTEKDYDFFQLGYTTQGNTTYLAWEHEKPSISGKGTLYNTYYIKASGDLEVFFTFTSDGALNFAGVTIKKFNVSLL